MGSRRYGLEIFTIAVIVTAIAAGWRGLGDSWLTGNCDFIDEPVLIISSAVDDLWFG